MKDCAHCQNQRILDNAHGEWVPCPECAMRTPLCDLAQIARAMIAAREAAARAKQERADA